MERLIQVVSEAKGSNHGGKCLINEGGSIIPTVYYIKHCSGAKIRRGESNFVYQHQPIYEAITCEMALRLGLETANFYILLNPKKNLVFVSNSEIGSGIKSNQPYYFASELLIPSEEDLKRADEIIDDESFYLNMLMVSDVKGKKQNYFYDNYTDKVIYIDMGCNFIDAHGTYIQLKRRHQSPLSKKDRKKALKKFEKYSIKTKSKKGDIGLVEFLNMPRDMKMLTLNPYGRVKLNELISNAEIDEICERLIAGLYHGNQLKRNGDSPYLIRH